MWLLIAVTVWAGDGGAHLDKIRVFDSMAACEKVAVWLADGKEVSEGRSTTYYCVLKP